jgi:methyltransferase-like protein
MHPWKFLQISRRGIAMDPRTGDSFRLNESAAFILNSLQRDKAPQDIAKSVAEEFGIVYESALSDVYEFMANLTIQGGT